MNQLKEKNLEEKTKDVTTQIDTIENKTKALPTVTNEPPTPDFTSKVDAVANSDEKKRKRSGFRK